MDLEIRLAYFADKKIKNDIEQVPPNRTILNCTCTKTLHIIGSFCFFLIKVTKRQK
jgi:hypothetical protein